MAAERESMAWEENDVDFCSAIHAASGG